MTKDGKGFSLQWLKGKKKRSPWALPFTARVRCAPPTMKGKASPSPRPMASRVGGFVPSVPPLAADLSGAWIAVFPRYGEFTHDNCAGAGSRHQA